MNEKIKDLQEDLADEQKATIEARVELADAEKWYNKMLVREAQAIIRLHEAQKEI